MTATLQAPAATVRTAIYLRISLDATGEQLAIQRQRDDAHTIAAARGWQIVGEYVDNSISASDARKVRPGYDALVSAYERGDFDALIVWDLDRLSRQPRQLEDSIDAAEGRGLVIVTANGEADLGNDNGRMFARMKMAVARSEVDRKSARQRRAKRQRAEAGMAPKGPRLTGYTTNGAIIDDEAAVVQRIFANFAAGDSLKGIARTLTQEGVPPRSRRSGESGQWDSRTVRDILTNQRYAGRVVYRGEVLRGVTAQWEPLVSEGLFDAVRARLEDPRRATNRHGTDRVHLGSGLYRCAVCGGKVRFFSGGRYRCPEGHVNRSMVPVDTYVVAVVEARLGLPDLADILPRPTEETAPLTAERIRLRERLATIESDYDAGLIDGRRYRVATEKVTAELDAVEKRLAAAAGTGAGAGVLACDDPVAAFREAPLMIRRAVIDELFTVTLRRGTRGSRTFNPETVIINWKGAA